MIGCLETSKSDEYLKVCCSNSAFIVFIQIRQYCMRSSFSATISPPPFYFAIVRIRTVIKLQRNMKNHHLHPTNGGFKYQIYPKFFFSFCPLLYHLLWMRRYPSPRDVLAVSLTDLSPSPPDVRKSKYVTSTLFECIFETSPNFLTSEDHFKSP